MLAIIPARGGSKGIPGKNIRRLCGKPLIAWTIEAALAASEITRVVLSTDDEQIAGVGKACGAEVPFMRPAELATDTALAIDTYLYTLQRLAEADADYRAFVVLQPTSPLRTADDIDGGIKLFRQESADSVIGVKKMEHPPQWMLSMDDKGRISPYLSEQSKSQKNRQDYGSAYLPNGALFVLSRDLLQQQRTYYSENTYAYVMPSNRSIDIDLPEDLEYAEYLMEKTCRV